MSKGDLALTEQEQREADLYPTCSIKVLSTGVLIACSCGETTWGPGEPDERLNVRCNECRATYTITVRKQEESAGFSQ